MSIKKICLVILCFTLVPLSISACGKKTISFNGNGRKISSGRSTAQNAKNKNAAAVCKTANTQIGKPYRYGGTSPKTGFDCSGLVFWAFQQHGVALPRTARQQAANGSKVDKKNLAAGDVVVFRLKSGYHTGIYMGNGKFIHSPRKGKTIRRDDIADNYWNRSYVSARRYMN